MGFSYEFNIDHKKLEITISDMDVLLACKKSFSVPFSHIITPVVAKPLEAQKLFMGIHMGTRFPGVYNAGTFWSLDTTTGEKTKTFIHMIHPKRTIMLHLKDEEYTRLILELPKGKDNIEQEASNISRLIAYYQ